MKLWIRNLRLAIISKSMAKTQNMSCSFDDNAASSYNGEKLIYPAATRNQEPILQVLKQYLPSPTSGKAEDRYILLEVASGSGQHTAHFAPHFPNIRFQPSDFDENLLGSIAYYSQNCKTNNIAPPLLLDICKNLSHYGFKENSIDFIYNANMVHISPYDCTVGLFKNAGAFLKKNGLMITYGPYAKDGVITPESNISFDANLRSRNANWGLRDITELITLANINGLSLIDEVEMPSNNKTLVWKKT